MYSPNYYGSCNTSIFGLVDLYMISIIIQVNLIGSHTEYRAK